MIDNLVEAFCGKFIVEQQAILADKHSLDLNLSWETISILDQIVELNKSYYEAGISDKERLLPLACYLGTSIYLEWVKIFPKNAVKLLLTEKPTLSVVIKVTEGIELTQATPLSIDILDALVSCFRQKDKFEYSKGYTLPQGFLPFRISYLAFGIISCLSPKINGPWSKLTIDELAFFLAHLTESLTQDQIVNLQTINLGKENFLNLQVFYPHLILPPLGFQEQFLAMRPIVHLGNLYRKESLTVKDLKELGGYLIVSPSITHAAVGFVILNVLNRDFFKDILTEFYITYPLVAAQLKPAFEAFKELVGEADEDKKSLSNEINLPSMIFCSNEDVLQEGRYKPYFMGIQNFLIFESYTQGQALVRDKNISIILQQAYLAIELEQTEDAESLLLPLVKDTMNQKELEYLAYLETRLYLNSKEPKINSFVLNKFLNCIKFDLIENLKKKLLFESLAPQLENNAECTDFLKEIDDHGETISLKTDYFLAKIFKNNYSDLALGTKLTNLRRCLWSKFNVFKVDNRPHNHSQVK